MGAAGPAPRRAVLAEADRGGREIQRQRQRMESPMSARGWVVTHGRRYTLPALSDPAMWDGCDVGLVAVGVQEQAEDILATKLLDFE